MKHYFTLNTDNMKMLPIYLITSGIFFDERVMDRPEGFSEYLLLLTIEGTGVFESEGVETILEKGTLIFVPPHIPHSYYKTTSTWQTHWISFDGNGLEALFEAMVPKGIWILPSSVNDPVGDRLLEINHLTSAHYQKNALKISSIMYEMITDVVGRIQRQDENDGPQKTYLELVLHFMNEHYSEDITLNQLAEVSDISAQYLCRIFKEELGTRPFEYLSQLRIHKSKTMLLQSKELKIENIALAVGFSNPSYYGSIFKKYEKMTPKAFRKLHKRIKVSKN